jgi:Family of unknown function (DUF6353)
MTRLDNFERLIRRNAKNNSPLILSVVAGVGTIATAYLAGKATIKAVRRCEDWEELNGYDDDWRIRLLQRVKVSWTFYIPTAVSATSTIACVIAANRIGVRKTIAAQTALTISQQAFSEYRTKVIEQFGDRKDNAIRAAIAEDEIKKNQPPSQDLLITGPGNYLCYEQYTGRYFASDIEKLRKAENELNAKLLAHDYATLNDFYYMIGIAQTSLSGEMGWKSSKLMKLHFSAIMTDDERPCIAFEYNYVGPL